MSHDASQICARLEAAVSGEVNSSPIFRRYYSVDASSYIMIPEVVVAPKNTDDVSAVIMIARELDVSVTARGAGTGLVGGALNNGIILDMMHFDSVHIAGKTAYVGAGTYKGDLDTQLESTRMFFAPNPSIGSFCTMGGMLANNAAGSRSLKYGSMIDNVGSVTIVDGRGEVVSLPHDSEVGENVMEIVRGIDRCNFPKVEKNSSGYRLDAVGGLGETHKALIGSEGTLGVFVSAELSLTPRLGRRLLYVLEYRSAADAAVDCARIVERTVPIALEFVDRTILEQMEYGFESDTDCLLFAEYESGEDSGNGDRGGGSEQEATRGAECRMGGDSGGAHIMHPDGIEAVTHRAISSRCLTNDYEITRWWRYRDTSLHYSLRSVAQDCEERVPHIIEDASVPVVMLPKLFAELATLNDKYNTRTITYGHAGSGNIHVRLICRKGEMVHLGGLISEYFSRVISLGGSITGEHGDGLARSEYIELQYGPKNVQQFKRLKKLFDPSGVLNPGKIVAVSTGTAMENLWNFIPPMNVKDKDK